MFILHAHRTDFEHKFIELFTSTALLEAYLINHPNVARDEVTYHEVDPT